MRVEILREGSAARKVLDGLQGQILKTHQAIRATELVLLSADETRARLRSALQSEVYMRTPENYFAGFQQPDGRAVLPTQTDFAMLLHVFGVDPVLDLLMKRLTDASKGKPDGLPAVERAEKLRELRAQLDRLEISEELETLHLEEAGNVILRRREARPEILFQVWAELPATRPVSAAAPAATLRTPA